MRCCWSGGSRLNGGAVWPSSIVGVGASRTSGPNTRCTAARTMSVTSVRPSTLSLLTASANAYLSIGVPNLIMSLRPPVLWSGASLMRGTLVRSTYERTSAGSDVTRPSHISSGVPLADGAPAGRPCCTPALDSAMRCASAAARIAAVAASIACCSFDCRSCACCAGGVTEAPCAADGCPAAAAGAWAVLAARAGAAACPCAAPPSTVSDPMNPPPVAGFVGSACCDASAVLPLSAA